MSSSQASCVESRWLLVGVAVPSEAKESLPYWVKWHWVSGQARLRQGHQGSGGTAVLTENQWPLVGKFFDHWSGTMTVSPKTSCFLGSIATHFGELQDILGKYFQGKVRGSWKIWVCLLHQKYLLSNLCVRNSSRQQENTLSKMNRIPAFMKLVF